jgi:hypothetical protein
MKKVIEDRHDVRATLRVPKRVRDGLKIAAAVMGRPLYDLTTEALTNYLAGLKLSDRLVTSRRSRARGET